MYFDGTVVEVVRRWKASLLVCFGSLLPCALILRQGRGCRARRGYQVEVIPVLLLVLKEKVAQLSCLETWTGIAACFDKTRSVRGIGLG